MIESTMQDRPPRCNLAARVARWWIPERWAFLDAIPMTSVGKLDKKLLRARQGEGALEQEAPQP